MKQRLLVMNGQRLVQHEQGGKWETVKVEKAGTIKPGIYDIHLSALADKSASHDGPILHSDKDYIFQQVRKSYIKHERTYFEGMPEVGSNSCVKYVDGKAVVTASSLKLGQKISR